MNFCCNYIPNITRNAQSGKPGMLATAWNQVPGRVFSSNKLGLMFYKIVNCKKCVGVLQQIDERQERKIVLEHCADGMPLLSFMDIKIHENVGPIQLINQHCALPDEDDFNNLLCYFNMKPLAARQKPNNSHFAAFFNIISMDVSLATTTDVCDFVKKFKIPIHFDADKMAAQMCRKLMVHYQKHCDIHIAAWEGHRVYTSVMALENIEPSIELPGQHDEQAKDNLSSQSPIFFGCNAKIAHPVDNKFTKHYFMALKDAGKRVTLDLVNCIAPDWRSTMLKVIEKYKDMLAQGQVVAMDSDKGLAYLQDQLPDIMQDVLIKNHAAILETFHEMLLMDSFFGPLMQKYFAQHNTNAEKHYQELVNTFGNNLKPWCKQSDPSMMASSKYFQNQHVFIPMLYFLQLLEYGLCTQKALIVFEQFCGEPTWYQQGKRTEDIHRTEFIMYLVDKTTMITVTIMDKWKNDWSFACKAEMSKKANFFICHNSILEIMCIINELVPHPVPTLEELLKLCQKPLPGVTDLDVKLNNKAFIYFMEFLLPKLQEPRGGGRKCA